MKSLLFLSLMILGLNACAPQEKPLSANEILQKSCQVHDPDNKWKDLSLELYIQEPRVGNPPRYSILKMNNATGAFELIRNRDSFLSTHLIDEKGVAKVLLDGNEAIPDSLVKKYRLLPERNSGYQDFYRVMYGLPMSLEEQMVQHIGAIQTVEYNNQTCYSLPIALKEELFSKNWRIFISKKTLEFKGMEIYFPDNPEKGERLYFEGKVAIQGIHIPRIRHWHEYTDDEYSGSDIILRAQ